MKGDQAIEMDYKFYLRMLKNGCTFEHPLVETDIPVKIVNMNQNRECENLAKKMLYYSCILIVDGYSASYIFTSPSSIDEEKHTHTFLFILFDKINFPKEILFISYICNIFISPVE